MHKTDKRGRAVSMSRLDQLAQPTRRKGEHIRAVIERERQQQIEAMLKTDALDKSTSSRSMSRSLTHLASAGFNKLGMKSSLIYGNKSARPLRKSNTTKSMSQLVTAKLLSVSASSTSPKFNHNNKNHNNNKQNIEIDSRTTNVSVAGVFCFYLSFFFLLLLMFFNLYSIFSHDKIYALKQNGHFRQLYINLYFM